MSGDRLWACGCVEDVDANDPAAGTKPVQWALVAHRITTVTYSPKKL